MDFSKMTLPQYLNAIAGDTSTPGGGSVTAITAAQAAGLLSMVCRFTIGREKFKDVEERVTEMLISFDADRDRLFDLAAEDTVVFEKVMAAYKLPKDDPAKQEKLQHALKESSEVPFAVFNICKNMAGLAEELKTLGNPMLVSDVHVAAIMLKCGMDCSVENVEINLASIKDQDFCAKKRAAMLF